MTPALFLQGVPFPLSHYVQKEALGGFSFKGKLREAPKEKCWYFHAWGGLAWLSLVHVFICSWTHEPTQWLGRSVPSDQRMPGASVAAGRQRVAGRRLCSWGAPSPPSTGWFLRILWTGLPAAPQATLPESLLSPQGETQPASFRSP